MDIEFRIPHPATNEDAIKQFEKSGCTLPKVFRQFLLLHNGGRSPKTSYFDYTLADGKQVSDTIASWFGLNVDENFDLKQNQNIHNQPDFLINIGDSDDWIIAIGISDKTSGKIYGWESKEKDANIIFLAESFNHFVDALYDELIKFRLPNPKTSEKAIQTYEMQSGYKLPQAYRQFLLTHNGGSDPLKCRFDHKRPDGRESGTILHHLHGLSELGAGNENHHDYPDYLLDIGSGANILIGLGIRDETIGKVYGWRHNAGGDVILLADNFSEFLDILYIEE